MIKCSVRVQVPNRNSDPITARAGWTRGQIAVVLTLAMVTLLGVMYANWVKSQKTVDAAALAGANYVNGGIAFSDVASQCTGKPDDAQKAACTYVQKNGLAVDSANLKINEPGINLPACAPTPNIQVWAHRTTPAYFGVLIGLRSYSVATIATAKANIPVNTITQGLFPMGTQCTSPCSLSSL